MDETPQEITINFEVIDHMTGVIGKTLTKSGIADSPMTITTVETEIPGVVGSYISIWDPASRVLLESSETGTVTFRPIASAQLQVIRFHDGDGLKALYDEIIRKSTGKLHVERSSTWGRNDDIGATGNESVWTKVFSQANFILQNPFWLGSMSTGENQNWYGFKNNSVDGGVDFSQRWIYVKSQDMIDESQIRIGLGEELIEYSGEFNNLFDMPTQMTFCIDRSYCLNENEIAGYRFIYAFNRNK